METFHVRKVSLGMKRKYRISADDGAGRPGEPVGYAEKALKMADELTVYADEERAETLVVVRESGQGWLAALTGYEAFDADGRLIGSFGVLAKRSVRRATWQLDQPGLGRMVGTERNLKASGARPLLPLAGAFGEIAGALVKVHFDFELDGEPVLSIEKPKVFDDWYRVTARDDTLDRRLLYALAVTMESRIQH